MENSYLVTEQGSRTVFAVVTGSSNKELKTKAALAVEEEFSYDSVKLLKNTFKNRGDSLLMTFECEVDGDDMEIRDIVLSLTTIY